MNNNSSKTENHRHIIRFSDAADAAVNRNSAIIEVFKGSLMITATAAQAAAADLF